MNTYLVNPTLCAVGVRMTKMLEEIETCRQMINDAYEGWDPGYPHADSDNARAWDYLEALSAARYEIINRVETWDDYEEIV